MPTETTATILIGTVTRMMGGPGTMRAETLLALEEGSRASWRIVELDGSTGLATALANAPSNLLAHGLLAYLASRTDATTLTSNPRLEPLVARTANGSRYQTRVPDSALEFIVRAIGEDRAIVVTILPGSTANMEELEQLRALGVRIEETL